MRAAMTEPERAGTQPDGTTLLARVARGDESAVGPFYEQYADAVFRFVYRRAGECYEDAEEITQDTFLAAVACAATFDGSCAALTWLCSLARVRIADFHRRRSRLKRVPPGSLASLDSGTELPGRGPNVEETDRRLDAVRILDRALGSLAAEEREVLLLRYVEQFSVREIAFLM